MVLGSKLLSMVMCGLSWMLSADTDQTIEYGDVWSKLDAKQTIEYVRVVIL